MKKSVILSAIGGASLLALALVSTPTAAQAQGADSTTMTWTERYRTDYEVPFGQYTGRSPYMTHAAEAPKAPAKAPAAAPVSTVACSEMHGGLVRLHKEMPPEATLGQEFMVVIKATAVDCAANVVVTDLLPEGVTYVRSEPTAQVDGTKLVWKMARMDAGMTGVIKVWLKATQEGTLVNCATVSADPVVCAVIVIGKPVLTITKVGPQEARINEPTPFTIVVKNVGTAVAKNVVVTDNVPDGLMAAGGQKTLTFNVGDLAPGQAKTIPVALTATDKTGSLCNTAAAVASNCGQVDAKACVDVVRHLLNLTKSTTDKRLVIGRTATYTLTLSNPGNRTQTGVVLTDTAAIGTTIEEAPGATIAGNVATWNVGSVEPGASKTFTVKIKSRQPGNFCDVARVVSVQGSHAEAQDCSEWIGVSGVLLEMVDDPDPIPVGDNSKYTIRVTNQGSTRAIEQLAIVATLPAELELVAGSVSDGGTVSGKTITWPVLPSLAPKAVVTHTYSAKGVKAGDARSRVSITTSTRQEPIEKNESTTVF